MIENCKKCKVPLKIWNRIPLIPKGDEIVSILCGYKEVEYLKSICRVCDIMLEKDEHSKRLIKNALTFYLKMRETDREDRTLFELRQQDIERNLMWGQRHTLNVRKN